MSRGDLRYFAVYLQFSDSVGEFWVLCGHVFGYSAAVEYAAVKVAQLKALDAKIKEIEG